MKALRCCDCGVELPPQRKLKKCNRCHREQVRQWRMGCTLRVDTAFPGVDIDAIHNKRRAQP